MTSMAPVFRRNAQTHEQDANLGVFEFAQLPIPGDLFNIQNQQKPVRGYRFTIEECRVICVSHEPNRRGEVIGADRYRAFVYVELIRE